MMRNLRDALCLLALAAGLFAHWSPARGQPRAAEPAEWQAEIDGVGPTVADAKEHATERACEQLRDYLAGRYPTLRWMPDAPYLWSKRLVEMKGLPVEIQLPRPGETAQQVTLLVRFDAEDLKDLEVRNREQQAKDRTQRGRDRHRLAALVLAGIAAGLVVLKGYLWLEEATRGYSTGVLRLVALVLVGLVVAVLIWVA